MPSNSPLKPRPKQPLYDFRGTKQFIYAEESIKVLPDLIEGDPALFMMTRWHPIEKDRAATTGWEERNLDWCRTLNPRVIYGVERWGGWDNVSPDLEIKGKYMEWFSLCIIHPRLTPARFALKMCEGARGLV